jgi:3-oxoacyl-[acyl-carrier-protein] synthase-3
MGVKILGIEYFLPINTETLQDLSVKKKGGGINRVFEATGINKRHISNKNEDSIQLGLKSAIKILKKFDRKKIDFLIFVSQTSPYKLPSAACILQDKLSLRKNIMAFDVNQGCSGFIYALEVAKNLMKGNKGYKYGLIVLSDTYTKFISKNNTSCRPIFSDASSSVLIKKTSKEFLGSSEFGTDGSGAMSLKLSNNEIYMDGAKIAIFSLSRIPMFIKSFLKNNKINNKKLKLLALHQASKYVCNKIKDKLNLPNKKFYFNYTRIGNTVSSSIPIVLKDCDKRKTIKNNDTVVACGFGVGLSWGITQIKWSKLI